MDLKERGLRGVSIDDQGFWIRYGWMGGETPGRIRLPHPPEELPIEKAFKVVSILSFCMFGV